ncbi:MAG TPA: aromatic ring-hydroxylating dioxygenase subunit alpha [Reyranella sp.]|nr:aromatic ring-hydroxylating dioxygenase subunit alpha [Reyranella sp.]
MLDVVSSFEEQPLFQPETYAAVRRPLLEASTLPPACYTSPAFYRREVQTIFMKVWNFIGRADRIPDAGDYFTIEFAGVPVIVMRGADGEVRAFANSCRHRGALLLDGEGNCRAIRCPYHSWTYDTDGKLIVAPEMDATSAFDPAEWHLTPIRLESWAGFIFINFDDTAPPLRQYLGDLPHKLESYRFDDMVCVRRREYVLNCNWKIYVENAMEAYHIATVHRSTLSRQKGKPSEAQPADGEYCALFKEHKGTRALLAGDVGFPEMPHLQGMAAQGSWYPLLYPSTMFGCTYDCMWWLELHPMGPEKTKLIVGSCFPRSSAARPDFEEVVQRYYKRWDISIPEDNHISELQQRGLSSPLARQGRLAHVEPLVHTFGNWVLDHVLGVRG